MSTAAAAIVSRFAVAKAKVLMAQMAMTAVTAKVQAIVQVIAWTAVMAVAVVTAATVVTTMTALTAAEVEMVSVAVTAVIMVTRAKVKASVKVVVWLAMVVETTEVTRRCRRWTTLRPQRMSSRRSTGCASAGTAWQGDY